MLKYAGDMEVRSLKQAADGHWWGLLTDRIVEGIHSKRRFFVVTLSLEGNVPHDGPFEDLQVAWNQFLSRVNPTEGSSELCAQGDRKAVKPC